MPLRKPADPKPLISQVTPPAAIAGGELQIRGKGFAQEERPKVTIGEVGAPVIIGSDSFVIARVPEGATAGELVVGSGTQTSDSWACDIGMLVADSLHPVTNPAVDSFGNIFTTFSGSRGQKVPVAVYKIDLNFAIKPFINELMNATALTFDEQGMLYISSRYDGFVYQVTPNGNMSVYVEGMGVATGIAFDGERNLYVGDRSGTIFKISPTRQIFVFATLEPSISAYHLTFGPDGYLYVTGPTTSSFDAVFRISITKARSKPSTAASAARKAWHSTRKAVSTSPPPSPAARASCASIPTVAPTCSSPVPASSASPSPRRAPWSWPPPTPSTASMSESKGGLSTDERRNHRHRQRDARRRSPRHQLALPHRGVEQTRRRSRHQMRHR